MPTIKSIEDQAKGLIEKQTALVEVDERPWSEKSAEYEAIDKDVKALLDQHAALKGTADVMRQFNGASEARDETAEAKSPGEEFVNSKGFQNVAGKSGERRSSGNVELKTTLTLSGAAGVVFPQYQQQVVQLRFQRLTIADLLPSGQISGGSLIYPVESTFTNAAATVAEGGAKPASTLAITNVTENIKKIAHTIKISDETLQDALAVRSYVDGRMVLGVQIKEEQQLYAGAGSGSQLTGITARSGKQTDQAKGTDDRAAAIYKQMTNIRALSFLEPDGIVMHPTDWQTLRLTQDANGQYYGGGPFTGAYGNGGLPMVDRLWGLPVVVTTAATQGTALVGAFAQSAQLFRKGGITVEATNANEDDFLNNLVAIRAEERLLLACYYPKGFGLVTGL
jgi:HK97 family phage major capsid protein